MADYVFLVWDEYFTQQQKQAAIPAVRDLLDAQGISRSNTRWTKANTPENGRHYVVTVVDAVPTPTLTHQLLCEAIGRPWEVRS